MKKSLKMRLICGIVAAVTALGALAVPAVVKADDIEGHLDRLDRLTPQELYILKHLEDLDDDGDVDEDDVEMIETLLTMGVLNDYEKRLAMDILHHAHKQEREGDVNVTGVYFDSDSVALSPGQTFQDCAHVEPDSATNQSVSYYSSDTSVAVVDQNAVITAITQGSCIITAITSDGNYSARVCVNVNPSPAVAAQTQTDDASWNNTAAAVITSTPPGGTANLVAPKAISFNSAVFSALAARPDVSLLVAFPYKGHTYLMSIPAGYNLASKVNSSGTVGLLALSAANDGQINVVMTQ